MQLVRYLNCQETDSSLHSLQEEGKGIETQCNDEDGFP